MESPITEGTASGAPVTKWLDAQTLNVRGSRRDDLRALAEWLKAHDHPDWPVAQVLLGHQTLVSDPAASMRGLIDQIVAELSRSSRDAILSLLGRVVHSYNQRRHMRLPLPEIPVSLPKPVPPFTPARWKGLAKYRVWRNAVLNDIGQLAKQRVEEDQSSDVTDLSRKFRVDAGRVLASAALWGGLLCRKDLDMLCFHLEHWPDVSEFSWGRMYVTWSDENGNCRRWKPDAITAFLIMRVQPTKPSEFSTAPTRSTMDRILTQYFREILPHSVDRPASTFEFLNSCLMHFELRLPPCLAQYASGEQQSFSPNPQTWARLVGGKSKPLVASPMTRKTKAPEGSRQLAEIPAKKESPVRFNSADWLTTLRELLGSDTASIRHAEALKRVYARMKTPGISREESLFLAFAADALRSRKGKRLRMKSVRDRVVGIAKRLPAVLDLNGPGALAPELLAGAYTVILEDAISPNQHRKLRSYLRNWHRWLVSAGYSQRVDDAEVFGSSSRTDTVDARLILEDEYLRVRNQLLQPTINFEDDRNTDHVLRHVAGLILVLGYRCGARKMEILKARLTDLLLDNPAELLVRPWSERRLKSPNAVRKLPLYALLDDCELEALSNWKELRIRQNRQTRNPSPFLFYVPSLDRLFVPEGRIFPIINSLLREATGDQGVHFHILRKSGAGTWLAFALLRPPHAPLPAWLCQPKWQAQKRRIENSASLHKRLYANDFQTRRHLFLIARTLGHGSTEVSQTNYLELQGELLTMWLDDHVPILSQIQIQALAGVSQATASGVLKKGLYPTLWEIFGRRWRRLKIKNGRPRAMHNGVSELKLEETWTTARERFAIKAPQELLEIESILMALSEGATIEDLTWSSGCSVQRLEALFRTALDASDLTVLGEQSREDKRRAIHVHNFFRDGRRLRPVYPSPLRAWRDLEVFERFGHKVFSTMDQEDGQKYLPLARHWLYSRRDDRNGLGFSAELRGLASEYLRFILDVGVAPAECQIRYFGAVEDLDDWSGGLPQPFRDRVQAVGVPFHENAERTEVVINLVFDFADNQTVRSGAYGWRYSMLMASLWSTAFKAEQDVAEKR